jgi:hypothetical protein
MAVERAARRLIKSGLRLTPDGLIVRENDDNTDAHYELCYALDAIEPLNDPEQLKRVADAAKKRFRRRLEGLVP